MPVGVEVRLIRLARRFEEQRRLLQEGDADGVRARLDRHADLEVLHRLSAWLTGSPAGRCGCTVNDLHALPIEQQFDLVRLAQALDLLVAIARQADLDLVFPIPRERVVDDGAAARAEGKSLDVLLLREVWRHADRLAARRAARAPDRDAADLLRRRHIAIQQRRRQIADRHVVEAVARFVGWQQRRGVDVEREQIADGVLVFGAREAADRRRPPRIRLRRRRAIERRLQRRDHRRRRSRRPAASSRPAASGGPAAFGRPSPTRPDAGRRRPRHRVEREVPLSSRPRHGRRRSTCRPARRGVRSRNPQVGRCAARSSGALAARAIVNAAAPTTVSMPGRRCTRGIPQHHTAGFLAGRVEIDEDVVETKCDNRRHRKHMVWRILLTVVLVAAGHGPGAITQTTVPPPGVTEALVQFTASDGTPLVGKLSLPAQSAAPPPVVFFLHGAGPETTTTRFAIAIAMGRFGP